MDAAKQLIEDKMYETQMIVESCKSLLCSLRDPSFRCQGSRYVELVSKVKMAFGPKVPYDAKQPNYPGPGNNTNLIAYARKVYGRVGMQVILLSHKEPAKVAKLVEERMRSAQHRLESLHFRKSVKKLRLVPKLCVQTKVEEKPSETNDQLREKYIKGAAVLPEFLGPVSPQPPKVQDAKVITLKRKRSGKTRPRSADQLMRFIQQSQPELWLTTEKNRRMATMDIAYDFKRRKTLESQWEASWVCQPVFQIAV